MSRFSFRRRNRHYLYSPRSKNNGSRPAGTTKA